eukprot:6213642-Pleurochrysis_carterae.AAC.3
MTATLERCAARDFAETTEQKQRSDDTAHTRLSRRTCACSNGGSKWTCGAGPQDKARAITHRRLTRGARRKRHAAPATLSMDRGATLGAASMSLSINAQHTRGQANAARSLAVQAVHEAASEPCWMVQSHAGWYRAMLDGRLTKRVPESGTASKRRQQKRSE